MTFLLDDFVRQKILKKSTTTIVVVRLLFTKLINSEMQIFINEHYNFNNKRVFDGMAR